LKRGKAPPWAAMGAVPVGMEKIGDDVAVGYRGRPAVFGRLRRLRIGRIGRMGLTGRIRIGGGRLRILIRRRDKLQCLTVICGSGGVVRSVRDR
jgi:hypothetical protein